MGEKIKTSLKIIGIVTIVLVVLLGVEIIALRNENKIRAFEKAELLADYAITLINQAEDEKAMQMNIESMPSYDGSILYVADSVARVIVASFDPKSIGTVLSTQGVKMSFVAENETLQIDKTINGKRTFAVAKVNNGMLFVAGYTSKHANRMIWKNILLLLFCMIIVDSFAIFAIGKVTIRLYKEEEKSNKDRMTELFNRRAYETNLSLHAGVPQEDNFVYVAMDLNELKNVNDTFGHEVGDEMIKGAADIIKRCFGSYGRSFRIGGDEFVSILFADSELLERIKADFEDSVNNWAGKRTVRLSISLGYATHKEFPDKTVRELAKVADDRMYRDKENYYRTRGVDRRRQKAALDAICASYVKILKVNLTTDDYEIISMPANEKETALGYSPLLSDWLKNLAGYVVHEDDREEFLKATNIETMRNFFKTGEKNYCVFYKRLYGDVYRNTRMELTTSNNYSDENQSLYLYVKDIDK